MACFHLKLCAAFFFFCKETELIYVTLANACAIVMCLINPPFRNPELSSVKNVKLVSLTEWVNSSDKSFGKFKLQSHLAPLTMKPLTGLPSLCAAV